MSQECLNLKSEWARSKIPRLWVNNPKGLVTDKEDVGPDTEPAKSTYREAVRRGTKRSVYLGKAAGEKEEIKGE